MKHILLIGNHPPPYGGVPVHIEQLAPFLVQRGWKVVVLSLMSQAPSDLPEVQDHPGGYTIYRPRFKHKLLAMFSPQGALITLFLALPFLRKSLTTYLSHIGIFFYTRRLAIRHDIRVVSAYHVLTAGLLGAWLKRVTGMPLVTTIFGEAYRERDLYGRLAKLVREVVESSDVLLSCSGHCAKSLAPLGYQKPVETVIYGIDIDRFKPENSGAEMRTNLGISPSALVIGFVARMVSEMGLHVVLSLAKRMLESGQPVHFLIAGTAGELTAAANELHDEFPDRVHVIANLSADLLPKCYAASDIVVVPSINERACLGLAIAEAMATGKVVVASRVGGHPEVITDRQNGLLVEPESAESLRVAIETLMADETGLMERLRSAARHEALARFDMRDTLNRMEQIFCELQ
jgi:L-malate glycosyltransferase